jgi:hypothetical protein
VDSLQSKRTVVEAAAEALGYARVRIWLQCPVHHPETLPRTSDTGEPFCPVCCTVFSEDGLMLNPPERAESA